MKKNQQGFGQIEILLLVVIVGMISFVGWYVWHSSSTINKSNATTPTPTNSQTTPKIATTAQDAAVITQITYDSYLTALKVGNKYNMDYPSANNKTLPQIGLAKVKDKLSQELYAKISADESTPGKDQVACVLYLPDKFTAVLKKDNKTSADIAVDIIGGGGANQGTINVTFDLSTQKITAITCSS